MTDEKKLKRLLRSGSKEKIEEFYEYLYNKYKPLLIFVSSKYLNDFEDIKDIVQDTFFSFFNNLNNESNHTNIKSLLAITAKNKSIDLLRRKKKIDIISYEELDNIESENKYSHYSYNDIIEDMKKVLSLEEIDIIIKHLFYGTSLIDIAKELNTNINSIKSIYYRSIKKYKEYKGIR